MSDAAMVFTDGGNCGSNPGPGGYAAIVRYAGLEQVVTGGFARTTNNRMELMAAIAGLEALPYGVRVSVVSDSQYVVNGFQWSAKWARRGWRSKTGPVANVDLWQRLLAACANRMVDFQWTRGHVGHPENERCDALAGEAAREATEIDSGYAR